MSTHFNNAWQVISRHKYLWTLIIFILIAGFLDENSMFRYWSLNRHNGFLTSEIKQYEKEYTEASEELARLSNSQRAYEEVARVRLFMKSDNEDIFIIENK